MKRFKKIMALVIAMAMVLGMMSMTAFAGDPPTTGSITITDSADGTVTGTELTGRTFNAYRILNATEVFDENGNMTGVAYTIPNATVRAALAAKFLTDDQDTTDVDEKEKGENETDAQYETRIIDAINTAATADVEQTAKDLLKIAKDSGLTPEVITGGTAKTGLPFGYYVIEDVTSSAKENVSAVMLDTNTPDVEIKVKATKPSLEKKIDEGTTEGAIDDEDVEYDNHRVGDTVPYVLESSIPEMTGYTKYYYIITDTLSKGLTFNDDVVIKVTKPAVEDDPATEAIETADAVVRTLVKDTDYTLTTTTNDDGSTSIEIVFKDFYNKEKAHAGEEMVITYSATVNGDAVIGTEGNPNTAQLIYSNNPNTTVDHDDDNEDKPKDITVIGHTPEQKTFTYVTGLKLKKVDPSGKALAGATFELSGNLNKVEVLKAEKYVQDEAGTYFALKDGTYTTTDPTTLNTEAENYEATIAKYVDPTGATKFKKTTVTEKTASGDPKTVSETTDAAGTIIFDGMGDGKFTLTETQEPTGYNKLATPIEFTVNWAAPATNSTECAWTVTDVTTGYNVTFDAASGEFSITVENHTGQELPSTGGIGTTIFYVVGALLVLGAGVVLITRRRMDA